MSDIIYVIGHKNPDTDTVVSAIVGADFLNKRDGTQKYHPRISGNLTLETQFVQKQFPFQYL